jgi:LPXTG-site transpeptidase (sortase) family protein
MDLIGKPITWDFLDMYAGPKESLSDDLVELYGAPPYCGGAVLYHCLRVRLGDEVFFRALQTLITENRWSTVNEEKFIEVFSRVSGEDLEDFIKSYLYYGENGHVPDLLEIETFEEAREKYKSVYPKDEPEPDEGLRFVRLMLPDALPAAGFPTSHRTEQLLRPQELPYGTTGLTLQIPGLDVMSPILTVPMEDGSYPVEWLENAVGLLDRSSLPGEGITIITGHNHLNSTEAGPFLFLKTMQEGDRIMITDEGSEMLTYQVYGNYKIAADDFISIAGDLQENSLVLITCEDETLDGTYQNRRVIFAR